MKCSQTRVQEWEGNGLFAIGYSVFSRVTFYSFAKSKFGTDVDGCKNSFVNENIVYKSINRVYQSTSTNCRVLKDKQQ